MIKSYPVDSEFNAHTVRITFMVDEYAGHIAFNIGGNCRGAALLNTDFLDEDTQEDIDRYIENDCDFRFHDDGGDGYFSAVFIDAERHRLSVTGTSEELKDMIVRLEIEAVVPQDL